MKTLVVATAVAQAYKDFSVYVKFNFTAELTHAWAKLSWSRQRHCASSCLLVFDKHWSIQKNVMHDTPETPVSSTSVQGRWNCINVRELIWGKVTRSLSFSLCVWLKQTCGENLYAFKCAFKHKKTTEFHFLFVVLRALLNLLIAMLIMN